jgi:hypothetical protein
MGYWLAETLRCLFLLVGEYYNDPFVSADGISNIPYHIKITLTLILSYAITV